MDKSVEITQEPIIINRDDDPQLPVDFSMLHIGRELSRGSVDIYDPWLTVFNVTPPERAVADPLTTFPVHSFMLVRDENVRVYSLSSEGIDDDSSFEAILNEASGDPVPLIESEPLSP